MEEFDLRFDKLWEDLRVDSWAAILWNPIHMAFKVLYVLNIMLFADSP